MPGQTRRTWGTWWGPDGFTTSTHEIDIRPGGVWCFTMHGPDGVDYPNEIAFEEIVPPGAADVRTRR